MLQSFGRWQQQADEHHQYRIRRTQQLRVVGPAYRLSIIHTVYRRINGQQLSVEINSTQGHCECV